MLSKSKVKTTVHHWYKAYGPEELRKLTQNGGLERVVPQKAQAMLSEQDDAQDRLLGHGLSEEEKEEVWESQEPSIMEDILEALDAERMDAGGQYPSFE